MITKLSSPHAGVRTAVLSAALLLLLIAALSVSAFADEYIGFIDLNDSLLDNSGCGVEETMLGDIYADAVKSASGAQFALVCAGSFSEERLEHGKVTLSDVERSLAQDGPIVVTAVTAAQLKQLIETAVGDIVLDMETEAVLREESYSEAFVQISGFTFVCDVSAPPGDRVMSVTVGESSLDFSDDETVYTLAAGPGVIDGGADAGVTLSQALTQYIPELEGLIEYPTGRIKIVGTTDDKLIDGIPIWTVVFALAFFTLAGLLVHRAKEQE